MAQSRRHSSCCSRTALPTRKLLQCRPVATSQGLICTPGRDPLCTSSPVRSNYEIILQQGGPAGSRHKQAQGTLTALPAGEAAQPGTFRCAAAVHPRRGGGTAAALRPEVQVKRGGQGSGSYASQHAGRRSSAPNESRRCGQTIGLPRKVAALRGHHVRLPLHRSASVQSLGMHMLPSPSKPSPMLPPPIAPVLTSLPTLPPLHSRQAPPRAHLSAAVARRGRQHRDGQRVLRLPLRLRRDVTHLQLCRAAEQPEPGGGGEGCQNCSYTWQLVSLQVPGRARSPDNKGHSDRCSERHHLWLARRNEHTRAVNKRAAGCSCTALRPGAPCIWGPWRQPGGQSAAPRDTACQDIVGGPAESLSLSLTLTSALRAGTLLAPAEPLPSP